MPSCRLFRGLIMRCITALLAVLLIGCAATNPANEYAIKNKPLAEQGQIKWSTYYTGLYNASMRSNDAGRANVMRRANSMIQIAMQYENGEIDRNQFEYHRRNAQAGEVADLELIEARKRAAIGEAIQAMSESNNRANLLPEYQIVPPVKLQSQPLQLPPIQSMQQHGVTAFFTGQQHLVQTVTNQQGWECQYNYAGKTFTRIFTGSCPSSVQVQ